MDPVTLSAGLTALLAPLVPFLAGVGKAAAQTAAQKTGERLGEETFQRVASLWDRLWPRLRGRDMARRAVADVAADPRAADRRAALARELESVLRVQPQLAQEAAELLRQVPKGWFVQAGGVASGMIVDNTVITGDQNVVQTGGKYNVSLVARQP